MTIPMRLIRLLPKISAVVAYEEDIEVTVKHTTKKGNVTLATIKNKSPLCRTVTFEQNPE